MGKKIRREAERQRGREIARKGHHPCLEAPALPSCQVPPGQRSSSDGPSAGREGGACICLLANAFLLASQGILSISYWAGHGQDFKSEEIWKLENMGFLKMMYITIPWIILYETPLKRRGHLPFHLSLWL